MNERIEFVSDEEVRIKRHDDSCPPDTTLRQLKTGMLQVVQDGWFDHAGLLALRECIDCYLRDGNFRSLAPAPRYRAYTPVEAAQHLGRHFSGGLRLTCVRSTGIRSMGGSECTYAEFVSLTWDDDHTPCGQLCTKEER